MNHLARPVPDHALIVPEPVLTTKVRVWHGEVPLAEKGIAARLSPLALAVRLSVIGIVIGASAPAASLTVTIGGPTDGTFGGVITGTGGLIKEGSGTETLTGTNTFTGGTFINAGTLAIGAGGSLAATGAVTIAGPGAGFDISAGGNQAIGSLNGVPGSTVTLGSNRLTLGGVGNGAYDGLIAGTGGLVKNGGGTQALGGANTFSGGVVLNAGGLTLGNNGALGIGALTVGGTAALDTNVAIHLGNDVNIADGAKLQVLGSNLLTLHGVVSGAGGMVKDGASTLILTGANTFTGGTTINSGTLTIGTGGSLALTGAVNLAGTGTLDISTGGNQTIGSLAGVTGSMIVLGGNALSFGGAINAVFSGNVGGSGGLVKNGAGAQTLDGNNTYQGTTTLNAGTLIAGTNTALGSGDLNTAGGTTLDANTVVTLSNNIHLGGALNIGGSADLTLAGALNGPGGLVKSGAATLTLDASNGHLGGVTLLAGRLTVGNNAALGLGNLTVGGASTLESNAAVSLDNDVTLNAELAVSGSSNLTLGGAISGPGKLSKTGTSNLTLNSVNTYQGGTSLNSGALTLGNAAALGTGGLTVGGASTLANSAPMTLANNVNVNAALTVAGTNNLTLSGVLAGAGMVNKEGPADLTLSGNNSFSGVFSVQSGSLFAIGNAALGSNARVVLGSGTHLNLGGSASLAALTGSGTATVSAGNTLNVGGSNQSSIFSGILTGAGMFRKTGTGSFTMVGVSTVTGGTSVAAGTLAAGGANTFSAASAHNVAPGATLDLAGFSQAVASLANSGTVSLAGATAGTTLTVNGNYAGTNGVLKIGTALNGTGPSDRLVISGGTATGKTSVQVANLGGMGALTSGNGIEVVSAQNGATTTAQTTRDAFSLAGGHVDAGAYEYRLFAADASGAGENWYLRSSTSAVTPPTAPNAPGAPVVTYRPEVSLYAALPSQLRQGNLAMLGDLRKRVGDDDVKGAATSTSPTGADRRAWARVLSTDIDVRQGGSVSPGSKGRLTGFQAGTDLLATPNWRAGLYVGQLDGDARINGFASGIQNLGVGNNDLRSQYVGIYGTYTGDNGFYADAVVQSGRHRYTVQPSASPGAQGKGHSLLGSIEVGQSFALGGGWGIEPQLQLIHQHMDLDGAAIEGAIAQPQADSGWIARAGVRIKGEIDTGIGTLQPYGRVNVYRTSSGADIARFVNGATTTDISAPTGGTSTEFAGGFTLALSQATSLYGEIGKLWTSGGNARVKSSVNGSVGMRVKW